MNLVEQNLGCLLYPYYILPLSRQTWVVLLFFNSCIPKHLKFVATGGAMIRLSIFGMCLAKVWIFQYLNMTGSSRKKHRKRTTRGGAWVDCLVTRIDYSCIFCSRLCSPWQLLHSRSPYSCRTNCTWRSSCSRSPRLYGTEATSC